MAKNPTFIAMLNQNQNFFHFGVPAFSIRIPVKYPKKVEKDNKNKKRQSQLP
jgi:hypothetical protein